MAFPEQAPSLSEQSQFEAIYTEAMPHFRILEALKILDSFLQTETYRVIV